jgi:outer membrane protein assembly factor BamB
MALVALFALICLVLSPVQAADTGVYRGPENSGVYLEKGLLKEWPQEGPKLLWKHPLNQGYAGVAVVDGLVYIAHGMDNSLDVLTLDGELRHHIPTGNSSWKRFGGTRSTPIVEGGMVVTTTPDAHVYGVDLKAGGVRWKLNAWTNFGSGASAMGVGTAGVAFAARRRRHLRSVQSQ